LNGALIYFNARLLEKGVHQSVLLIGNLALAAITGLSYSMNRKGLQSADNNAFVRRVYASTLSKMMLCLVGITVYVVLNRAHTSKETIFILMFLYVVYTVIETISLQQLTKKKK
jgi:small-conductance mechanosensitive channel